MRFKVDENLPAEVISELKAIGHDAAGVLDQRLGGSPDASIFQFCVQEKRALITLDLDFADIRAYPPEAHSGIIVLRLSSQDKNTVLAILRRTVTMLERETLGGRLWIADGQRIRIRGGEPEP